MCSWNTYDLPYHRLTTNDLEKLKFTSKSNKCLKFSKSHATSVVDLISSSQTQSKDFYHRYKNV